MSEPLRELFVREKPVRLLIEINNPRTENYASELSKSVDCTYSHAVRVIQRMEKNGLVETEEKGRKKNIFLTDKGTRIAKRLSDLLSEF
ncbi:MAG: DNA-binding MarR family transcriptional regulator [Candidatus Nanohaloarchaea archaeon]